MQLNDAVRLAGVRRPHTGFSSRIGHYFDVEGVRRVAFEDTKHYRVSRVFLMSQRVIAKTLLQANECQKSNETWQGDWSETNL